MLANPRFYLATLALILGIIGSVYFFIEWLRHGRKHKFLLFWSLGFFLLYLFQMPTILANAGFSFVLTIFNPFFAVTFPLTFVGLILIYAGVAAALEPFRRAVIARWPFILWSLAAFGFFAAYFVFAVALTSRIPFFLADFLFFFPIHLLILHALWQWLRWKDWAKTKRAYIGILSMIAAILLALVRDLILVPRILAYPLSFWFITYTSFSALFVLQSLSLILLVAGFFLVHKDCRKYTDGAKLTF